MGVVNHLADVGTQRGGIDFPLIGGGLHQHGAAGGAHLAQRIIETADGGRAAGAHAVKGRAAIERINWRRGQRRYLVEGNIKLLGQKLGERGIDALPHFFLRNLECHLAIRRNSDEGVGIEDKRRGLGRALGECLRNVEAEQKPAARRRAGFEKAAPGKGGSIVLNLFVGGHGPASEF